MSFNDAQCQRARRDFPALTREQNGYRIAYLDGPGGTQVPSQVIDAVSRYYRRSNANTHGAFVTSAETDEILEDARATTATFLGAPSAREISFGANMTTLNFSLSRALAKSMQPGDEIIITALDHEANRGPWLRLRDSGIVIKEAELAADGTLELEQFEQLITERTRLVAVGMASNALGTVTELGTIRRLSSAVGAKLLVDAVHYAPHFPVNVTAEDVDFLLCSAYKFYGPHVGVLYAKPGLLDTLDTDRLRVQEQQAPFRIETGTLNHAALAGVAAAIRYIASWGEGATFAQQVENAMRSLAEYEHGLAKRYYEGLIEIDGVTVRGPGFDVERRAPTVSITIDGVAAEDAARALAEKAIAVWDGHFYALRAVEALGLVEQGGLLRVGVSMYNTREEIGRLLEGVREIARA
jgi:cysteine desulfurase family protein (TIGR01976 family)